MPTDKHRMQEQRHIQKKEVAFKITARRNRGIAVTEDLVSVLIAGDTNTKGAGMRFLSIAFLSCFLGWSSVALAEEQAPVTNVQAISALQKALEDRGYALDRTDGKWTTQTQEAVTLFQEAQGLRATGFPDHLTFQALGIPFIPSQRRG